MLWVCPDEPEPQRGRSEPCDPVRWQDLTRGAWQTLVLLIALSWLLHPPVASSPGTTPFPAREKFPFRGNSLFPGKACLRRHCTVPFNLLQTLCGGQLPRACPGRVEGSQGPSSIFRTKLAQLVGPSSHPGLCRAAGVSPWGPCSPRRLAQAEPCLRAHAFGL